MEIRTGTPLDALDASTVTLSTGERVPTRTAVLDRGRQARARGGAAGPAARPAAGASRSTRRCACAGRENVWAIGDAAAVPDPAQRRRAPSPPTASTRSARAASWRTTSRRTLRGRQPRPFRYRTLGVFVDMGQHKAVATMLGIRLRGFPAWFAARTYHLVMMPGVARRVRLMADWTVGLFFGRASAELGQLGHPPGPRSPPRTAAAAHP